VSDDSFVKVIVFDEFEQAIVFDEEESTAKGDFPDSNFARFLQWAGEKYNSIPPEYRARATFEIDPWEDGYSIRIYYFREKTALETEKTS